MVLLLGFDGGLVGLPLGLQLGLQLVLQGAEGVELLLHQTLVFGFVLRDEGLFFFLVGLLDRTEFVLVAFLEGAELVGLFPALLLGLKLALEAADFVLVLFPKLGQLGV